MSTISVWVDSYESGKKAALPSFAADSTSKLMELNSDVLATNLKNFLQGFQSILEEQPQEVGGFLLDEIELNVAVSADGGFQLVAKLNVAAKAGISIRLKRNSK